MPTVHRIAHRIARTLIVLLWLGAIATPARASSPPTSFLDALVVQPRANQPAPEIRRGYFTVTSAAGQERTLRIAIKDTGSEPFDVLVYPVDSIQTNDGVNYTARGHKLSGLGTWLDVQPGHLVVGPDEVKQVVATLKVPANLPPGQYVGGIGIEDARPQPHGAGTSFLINVHYRKVLAVVATVTGASGTVPTPLVPLEIGGVTLSLAPKGSQAQIDLRNPSAVLARGKVALRIGTSHTGSTTRSVALPTLLPHAHEQMAVQLPNVTLKPGVYDVQVSVTSDDGTTKLATWKGSVPLTLAKGTNTPTPAGRVVLAPSRPLAAHGAPAPARPTGKSVSPTTLPLLAVGLLLVVGILLGVGISLGLARRRARNQRESPPDR